MPRSKPRPVRTDRWHKIRVETVSCSSLYNSFRRKYNLFFYMPRKMCIKIAGWNNYLGVFICTFHYFTIPLQQNIINV